MTRSLIAALLLASAVGANAKLAPERWGRLSEEERHQMTRAERYFDQKKFENAMAEYELFLQLYGKSEGASYAQLMFAECTRRTSQVNTAMEEFRNVIDYFPGSPDAGEAQYSIGVCLTQSGDSEKAAEAFEKVVEKWPKSDFGGQARGMLCEIYWRTNQKDKWLTHAEYLATGEYKDSENLKGKSQRRLLMHLLATNQIPEGFALVERVQSGGKSVMAFSDWTSDAMGSRDFTEFYGQEIKKSMPGIANASVALIETKPASDPEQQLALSLRCARIVAASGQGDKATERYRMLVEKNPTNDTLRSELAGHYRNIGKFEDARIAYQALKDSYNADRQIAETYAQEGNKKRSIETYQAMLPKYPDKVADIQWRLGDMLQQAGDYQQAIAAFQQTQREPESLFRVAECQSSMKKNDVAVQTLVGVVNFFKSAAPEAQYKIAGYQAAGGNKEAAIATLKLVCKTYLNTQWAGRAHQDLSQKYGVDVTLGGAAKKKN